MNNSLLKIIIGGSMKNGIFSKKIILFVLLVFTKKMLISADMAELIFGDNTYNGTTYQEMGFDIDQGRQKAFLQDFQRKIEPKLTPKNQVAREATEFINKVVDEAIEYRVKNSEPFSLLLPEVMKKFENDISFDAKYFIAKKQGTLKDLLFLEILNKNLENIKKIVNDNPNIIRRTPKVLFPFCDYDEDAYKNSKQILEYLIANGANINEPVFEGLTLLLLAISSGNAYIVKTLLELGADPYIKVKGKTAFEYKPMFLDDEEKINEIRGILEQYKRPVTSQIQQYPKNKNIKPRHRG